MTRYRALWAVTGCCGLLCVSGQSQSAPALPGAGSRETTSQTTSQTTAPAQTAPSPAAPAPAATAAQSQSGSQGAASPTSGTEASGGSGSRSRANSGAGAPPESIDSSAPPRSETQLEAQLAELERKLAALEAAVNGTAPSNASGNDQAVAPASRPSAAAGGSEAAGPITAAQGGSGQNAADGSGQTPAAKAAPFAFADWSWLNGNSRENDTPLDTKLFTPEFRADVTYIYDYNHPADDTLVGSSESGRTGEIQLQQLGVGGDFHYDHVRGRLMTQFGLYSTMTPRNDASPARGQWDLADAFRYVSEAYGGYHWDALHGINLDAGIFMSYVGLFSYYNFDNWAYQPSYVSSNTPWFFQGVRIQIFPTEKLKIEPWITNGWQSYGRFNNTLSFGGQVLWRPNGKFEVLGNQYIGGHDTPGNPQRARYHTDDSIQYKYYERPDHTLDRMAFSLTGDAGCESGGGVSCDTNRPGAPKQSFLGYMVYHRMWFDKDRYGFTIGGGEINNPGRYLVLLPPINGATAISGTPYFTENPGDPYKAWDASATFDYMPKEYITFRGEFDHRAANVPYFAGSGGVTPAGGNQGAPGSLVPGFTPDLVKSENRINLALLVKF